MSKVQRVKGTPDLAVNFKRGKKERPVIPVVASDAETRVDTISKADDQQRPGKHANKLTHISEGIFRSEGIESIVESILTDKLKDVKYEPSTCKTLSQELAGCIMEKLKSLNYKRYKLVAVVSLGSIKERPGLQFGSRCFWNQNTDKFTSVKYTNGSLFAVAMIYGLYFE